MFAGILYGDVWLIGFSSLFLLFRRAVGEQQICGFLVSGPSVFRLPSLSRLVLPLQFTLEFLSKTNGCFFTSSHSLPVDLRS